MSELSPKIYRSGTSSRLLFWFTLPSVKAGEISPIHILNVYAVSGTISQIDISYSASSNAIITLSLLNSLENNKDPLFEIFHEEEIEGVASEVHSVEFINLDTPQRKKLYVQVQSTSGTKETGNITLLLTMDL